MSREKHKRKNPIATLLSVIGTFLLIVVVAACIPLTVPKAMGYHLYTVISGSMEPEIPVGSLVYIKYVEPKEIVEGDVIAFYGSDADGSIITHRVVSNSTAMGEFITKGDANEENDMNPVMYNQYMGKMIRSIPKIGGIVQTIMGGSGKVAVGCVIGLAVVLEIIATLLNRRLDDDKEE